MAGRIIYLEIDDEITTAASRIRDVDSLRIAVVLPYGSRVATSRINFRLLSRDALTHEKRLSIVSGDSATRALAASAGLPVFSSVAEYESSLVGVAEESVPRTEVPAVAAGAAAVVAASVVESMSAAAPEAASATAAVGAPEPSDDTIRATIPRDPAPTIDRHPVGPMARTGSAVGNGTMTGSRGRGGTRSPWLIGGAILALAVLVGAVGVYLLLPSARIVVTPRPERVGPLQITVVADPRATAPSGTPPVVPAKLVTIPVAVNATFPATGKRVALTKATGSVRFENLDPTSTNQIVAGSIVRTDSGVRFRTALTITVPRAEVIQIGVGFNLTPGRLSVGVTAVDGGPDGNVDAGKIVVVPNDENGLFLKVTNPDPTTGGAKQEFTLVTQQDIDSAVAALNTSLQAALQAAIADPSLATGGATVFPSTGTLGASTPTVPPKTLVGQEVATFDLGLSATGTVITADTVPVAAIAEAQLRAAVKPGYELVARSMDIKIGAGVAVGQTVSFPVIASAQQIANLDPALLRAKILGKPVNEAKAILAPYGQVELTVSPDWTGSVPNFESRVDLTIQHAVQIETPSPSGSATP